MKDRYKVAEIRNHPLRPNSPPLFLVGPTGDEEYRDIYVHEIIDNIEYKDYRLFIQKLQDGDLNTILYLFADVTAHDEFFGGIVQKADEIAGSNYTQLFDTLISETSVFENGMQTTNNVSMAGNEFFKLSLLKNLYLFDFDFRKALADALKESASLSLKDKEVGGSAVIELRAEVLKYEVNFLRKKEDKSINSFLGHFSTIISSENFRYYYKIL